MPRIPSFSARRLFSSFRNLFSVQKGQPRLRTRLVLEELESRLTPSAIPVTTFLDSADPGSGSLRAAIFEANNNADPNPTITLESGSYSLDLGASDDSNPAVGDLDLNFTTPKTLTIEGAGTTLTTIEPQSQAPKDRIFEIGNANVTVIFKNLTIAGGKAAGSTGTSASVGANPVGAPSGGDILNNGGNVILDHAAVQNGIVQGAAGAPSQVGNGTPHQPEATRALVVATPAGDAAAAACVADPNYHIPGEMAHPLVCRWR